MAPPAIQSAPRAKLASLGLFDEDSSQVLYLVDISSFIFRAFYAIRSLTSPRGEPTNAVYGVAAMLGKLFDDAKPKYLAIAQDSPPDSEVPSFRKVQYAEYKANRSAPPEDLVPQFARIDQLVEVLGLPTYRQPGMEADDLIATLTHRWCAESPAHRVVIVTSDKDLMQLVDDRVRIWDTMKNVVYDSSGVVEKFGVLPTQIRDYLGLVGDSSDNIPGVAGVGPKTAVELLKQWESLEGVLMAAASGKIAGKRAQTLVECADLARLSAELATVKRDLDVEASRERLSVRFELSAKARSFLEELGFQTLVKKWSQERPMSATPAPAVAAPTGAAPTPAQAPAAPEMAPASATAPARWTCVQDTASLARLVDRLTRSQEFAFDVETTSLNPRAARLVGLSFCASGDEAYYVPVGHREGQQLPLREVLEALRPVLENPRIKKIGQNLKFDLSVMAEQGLPFEGIGADTMVASYVLQPEARHNLDRLAAQFLNHTMLTYEDVCGKGASQIGFDEVSIETATRYSAEDAWAAFKLWRVFLPLINAEKLLEVFSSVDMPLVSVLSRMERQGVRLDVEWLQTLSREFDRTLRSIEERVHAFAPVQTQSELGLGAAPGAGPINLNSPKQIAHLLFDVLGLPPQGKTKTGLSTDASVLEALAPLHEVPRLLLEYREVAKLKGTYVDPLPGMIDPKTGRIHAGFHQAVAATGRLSSSDPNLQNIPIRTERGMKIRRAFIPATGHRFVAADYSQIELRLLAHMSADPSLCEAFARDLDVHRMTAAEIYGCQADQVTDEQRGLAKAINFGLMYGKTAFGLAQELGISRKEAQEMITRYFERYAGVKRFLDGQITQAKERGYALTLLGRKRPLPDLHSKNPAMRAVAERMAMNTPIQGTAADLMKLGMIGIDHELTARKLRSKLIIQVHDEVVLECPEAEADAVQKIVVEILENAMKLSVPLRVNAASGLSWADL